MNPLIAILRGGALVPLTAAAFLGLNAWGQADAEGASGAKDGSAAWLRLAFLLLTLAWVSEGVGHTLARGEAWAWDPARSLGVLAWLLCAGVLHLHHVPHLKGRKPARRGMAVGALLAFLICGLSLIAEGMVPAGPGLAPSSTQPVSTRGPSGP